MSNTVRADILGVLFMAGVVIVTLFTWRTLGGLASSNPSTESIGKAMLSITG